MAELGAARCDAGQCGAALQGHDSAHPADRGRSITWDALCTHGDSEEQVRGALLDQFDADWPAIGRSIRKQLREQGVSLDAALEVAKSARTVFRSEQAAQAPRIMDAMAATAASRH